MATAAEYKDDPNDLQSASVEFEENEQAISYKDKQSLIQSKKHPGIETAPLRDASFQQETICGFDGLKVIIVSAVVFALAITIGLIITIIIGDPQVKPHGAIASSNLQCSVIGKDIMAKKGGSSVDAAIAALICLGVVNGHASGLGGGGFMLVRESKSDAPTAYDFRETAPSNSSATMFADNPDAAIKGGLAIAVPGELKGMKTAHDQFGKVSWKDLFDPSIKLATDGFIVSGSLADHLEKVPLEDMPPRMQEVYAPGGVKVTEGATMTRPKLAKLLTRIADEGIGIFYSGDVADEIIETIKDASGAMKKTDLTAYQVETRSSISVAYHGYQISGLPAPSGGPFVLSSMSIMEGYNVSITDKVSPLYHHRLVEAFKFVTAMGSQLADPLFNKDVQNVTTEMLSKERAEHIRSVITDDTTHNSSYYLDNMANLLQSYGTSHVSVIDNDNDMVSVTSTINMAFGSLVMTESGIILNNEMDDFNWAGKSAEPIGDSEANYIEPGKRPQSHMAPVIAWNKTNVCSRKMAVGGTNGSRIWTGITQVILHLLGYKETLTESIQPMTRLHPEFIPNELQVEAGLEENIIEGLKEKNHKVVVASKGLSSVSAVMKESDKLYSYGDNRTIGAGNSQF